ncbi:MAG: type II toxin-antitoxin system HicA family toxin [Salinibacterium sp.]|nr:MAG: type II toxin-antitoxin system HicA family toxin [Salinibacterium sp.]
MKVRELVSFLERSGFTHVRTHGSHATYKLGRSTRIGLVVNHPNDEVDPVVLSNARRTLRSVGIELGDRT